MPKETFWDSSRAIENDGVSEPVLTVTWGEATPGIHLNGVPFDQSGIDRLQTALRRASGKSADEDTTINATIDPKQIARVIRVAMDRGTISRDLFK